MRILIDIGHPAHVHLFKNFAWEMQKKGHKILFTTREKEFETYLLKKYGFNYVSFGKKYKTLIGKIAGLLKFDFLETLQGIKFKPDILLSHGSIYAAHASYVLRKPHIALEDTGNMEQIKLYLPFSKAVLTSNSFHKNLGPKQISYAGYHELAYLHPNYFTPDINKIENLNDESDYVLLRFVSWSASHDIGQSGLDNLQKRELIIELSKYARIIISAEGHLSSELEEKKSNLPPDDIHHLLAFAKLVITEGATIASECAVLGTPAIFINSINAGTIDDQENYGLIYHYSNQNGVLNKALELLNNVDIRNEWQKRRKTMLSERIDVTAFLIWFVEDWPDSFHIMKANPEYQLRFKGAFETGQE